MTKQIYVNLPVSDLARSTSFYEMLGFDREPNFTDENASCLVWSDDIYIMLLRREFFRAFIGDRDVIDNQSLCGATIALTLDSKEVVRKFVDNASNYGGNSYKIDDGVSESMMFSNAVLDPDDNLLEPVRMIADFVLNQ